MLFFKYGKQEIDYLSNQDKQLGEAIQEIGHIKREVNPDIFSALMKIIIGQQISTKAQNHIWEKLQQISVISPLEIAQLPPETLQNIGLSLRKVNYMQGIAEKILSGNLEIERLKELDEQSIREYLLPLKGIGAWSVEMLLIFSLQRPNILSFGDLAIIRGMKMLYQKSEIDIAFFTKKKELYSPFSTVASLYLWEISSGKYSKWIDKK